MQVTLHRLYKFFFISENKQTLKILGKFSAKVFSRKEAENSRVSLKLVKAGVQKYPSFENILS